MFSARYLARAMRSSVSSAVYSLKANEFCTMSGEKTTNCTMEDIYLATQIIHQRDKHPCPLRDSNP
jgi:hypothetical protein